LKVKKETMVISDSGRSSTYTLGVMRKRFDNEDFNKKGGGGGRG